MLPFAGIVAVSGGIASAAEATFADTGGQLRLESARWAIALDAESGAIRTIEDRTAAGPLLRGGRNLWVMERHGAPAVESSACRMQHSYRAATGELELRFECPEAAVTVTCKAADEGPLWQAAVEMKRARMIGWKLPVELEFDVAQMHEFIFPEHLGLAFSRAFFEVGGAGMQRHPLGPKGMERLLGDRCQMRPVRDPPVAARPGRDAAAWLPEWYIKEMSHWKVTANRCPGGQEHDLSLVETEHGTWLSGYRLGGWGWLFRFGGMLDDNDSRPALASLTATLGHLYRTPPVAAQGVAIPRHLAEKAPAKWAKPPTCVGLVLAPLSARPGVKLSPHPRYWQSELEKQPWIREAGLRVVPLRDVKSVRAALAEPRKWFAVVNTLRESFVADAPDSVDSMFDAIKDYVRQGGIWWEAGGGYSFHSALVPAEEMVFRSANRDFCDFAALQSAAGRFSLFSVQAPDAIFVPTQSEISATGAAENRIGRYTHLFVAHADSQERVELPPQQMVLGQPHRVALAEYGRRNGFTRTLAEKTSPEMAEKLKSTILLKVSTNNLKRTAQIADQLRFPVLFHTTEFLRGGFDKQYPDHLPPNPSVGTGEDLARLIETCQRRGHLFMPYTNPTWWCVNPKGPTFERVGDAPLSRDFDGQVYPESYGESHVQGYTICAWHPAVRAANDVIRQQFTEQYPVAVLFQDQVGARGHRWDTNAAAPHAGAYLEGIHRIAQVDSRTVPLGTEDGHDRLINFEAMFCGLSGPWLPNLPRNTRVLYEDLWPEGAWRIEPLALYLAHDKVLFYHHDLGGFVRDRLDLSATLVMGYGLSWWTRSVNPDPAEADWIDRLCRLQAAIGPRCAGRPLDEFEYLAPRVIRSRWGDLEIIANLTKEPWTLDEATIIAPEGFAARAPDLEAGIFSRFGSRDASAGAGWVIRVRDDAAANAAGWSSWAAGPEMQGRIE
ncbi:MAG: DUF6259 domain-containing protein [Planctomycetota bacterium]